MSDQNSFSSSSIIILGAGGIVNDAHLPAYKIAGFTVAGIYDLNQAKAEETAHRFSIPVVFKNMQEVLAAAKEETVFDIALPAPALKETISQLPDGAAVLMQKPMGMNLEEAHDIVQMVHDKRIIAGVNFQLRYAPFISKARQIINNGLIGELCDIEVNVNVYTPWHLWDFLYTSPRVEILYHSIHYIDLIRSFLHNPSSVYAKTVRHPMMKELASVRTNIIMDYGDMIRANIVTNHCHQFGLQNQHSYIKFEGTKGAIQIKLGLLMNYPKGVEDKLEYVVLEEGKQPEWKTIDMEGGWFPHAFIGSMTQILLAAEKRIEKPDNHVDDCLYTMACVEAAYKSSEEGGVSVDQFLKKDNEGLPANR